MKYGAAPVPSDEMPVHWVKFPPGFAIAGTEITNTQCEAFDPDHARPSYVGALTDGSAWGAGGRPAGAAGRGIRGGGDCFEAAANRSASRGSTRPDDGFEFLGFRPAMGR